MITLYNMPLALNCYKVRLLCALLGVEYTRKPIDLLQGEHQTPDFLALNPAEVMAVQWVDLHDLTAQVMRRPFNFTPWLLIYLAEHRDLIFGKVPAQ